MLSESDIRNAGGIVHKDGNIFFTNIDKLNAAVLEKLQAQSEPVAWMGAYDNTDLYYRKPTQADVVPLYRHPAPVQQEEIDPDSRTISVYTDNKQTLVNALSRIEELEAQNKALAGAAKLTIAWYEAEDDHSKADFYKRLEMCRASESALRAAIAAAEGK